MRLVALAAIALALAPVQTGAKTRSGVKWVPLNQVQNGAPKKAAPVEPVAETTPSQASAPAVIPPAVPQAAPATTNVEPQTTSGPLNLTCLGAGTANKVKSATVWGNSNYSGNVGLTPFSGNSSGWGTVVGTQDRPFEDQVDLRLFNGDDRIRLPRTMLPGIHGGKAGWFKLNNVVADARSIRAKAAVNFLNNPNVFIDRVTGTISISGKAGDYAGQCQVIDANAAPRFLISPSLTA
jgi:hypothetical protein